MYIILVAILIVIAAYYPIKLIKFYCMESREQSVKNQIISDLRAGRVSSQLVGLILGDGGYRLLCRELDHIFEWMVANPDEWYVSETSDGRRLVVVFHASPFHPEKWDSFDTYKNVMRQMFGDYGTKDFGECRASILEASRIRQNLKDLRKTEEHTQVSEYEYVYMMFGDEKVLAMVVEVNDANEKLVAILSGTGKGQRCWVASNKAMEVIPNDVAISELVRLKEEWKGEKRKKLQEAARIEFQSKYGNIRPGHYLIASNPSLPPTKALYIVDSVDMENGTATCVRLVDLGIGFPANKKCVLPLRNGFRVATPEEVAKILLKEYSNE
ncbi:hypothetical protein BK745P4_00038 [Bacteroides phage BK745P4]|nr:hypothetical protein BK745P4_00038 [Bacteroides phage BK745P4]